MAAPLTPWCRDHWRADVGLTDMACASTVFPCVAAEGAVLECAYFSVWGLYTDAHSTGNIFQSFHSTGKINEDLIWLKA